MENKFKRKESDQPLTDLGKSPKQNNHPNIDAKTIDRQRSEKK